MSDEIHEYYSDEIAESVEETEETEETKTTEEEAATMPMSGLNTVLAEEVSGQEVKSVMDCITDINELTVTAEEKENFLDCLVNNVPYERDCSIFDGKITFKLRTITKEENNAIIIIAGNDDGRDFMERVQRYSTFFHVTNLRGVDVPPYEGDLAPKYDTKGDKRKLIIPDWVKQADVMYAPEPAPVMYGIYKAVVQFEAKYTYMVEKAVDQDFWKAGDSTFLC